MKPIPLQLVTIKLENGQQGVFVGLPLMNAQTETGDSQVSELWFSDIQDIAENLSVDQLIAMVQAQLCRCRGDMH